MPKESTDAQGSSNAPTQGRDFSPPCERLLIIGLDGATWDVLDPLMAEGRMPNLRRLVENGASGVLRSTIPPITPAAWTTFLTGRQPGSHGIIDFERYDAKTNRLTFNSTRCLDHVPTIWARLGDRGLRVGSVNVPMTFPAVAVNGFMVSGFETPGPNSDFVYPPDLKTPILQRWPDPTLRAKWRHTRLHPNRTFTRNVHYVSTSFHQGAELTTWLGDCFGWNALMVVFKLTDNLQHKTWKYLDPRWPDRSSRRRDQVKRAFGEADRALGTLVEYAERNSAAVLVVSDHGHGSLEGKVQANLLLKRWGYLALRSAGAQSTTRWRYWVDRLLGRTRKFAREGDIAHDLAVDFSNTRACVMHAGMAGFLYINLKGRQPDGIVEPTEYEALRDELRDRLLGRECRLVDPNGKKIQLFPEVHKPEELYGCTRDEQPWMPDLLLVPHETLAVVRKIRGRNVIRWMSYRRMEGTHRRDGIIIVSGAGVRPGFKFSADIVDCAPTVLAMLGFHTPREMEGRVRAEIFESAPPVSIVDRVAAPSSSAAGVVESPARGEVYSEAELQAVTDRLSDLGYLE